MALWRVVRLVMLGCCCCGDDDDGLGFENGPDNAEANSFEDLIVVLSRGFKKKESDSRTTSRGNNIWKCHDA